MSADVPIFGLRPPGSGFADHWGRMTDPCLICGEPVHLSGGMVMDTSPPIEPVVCVNGHEDHRVDDR